ncbi:MAG: IPExxxVDY family protein [Bacteroidales bacterium]|nr:IPExxxVDY family protein [Bacteroidales bacterium]
MSKSKYIIKQETDYICDFHYGSMALKSHLPEYKTCSLLNHLLNIELHKIPDLAVWHPSQIHIYFPFFLFEDPVSKISVYLISNSGFEDVKLETDHEHTLFQDIPKKYNMFGKKSTSVFPVKDLNIDYYLILKHPRDDKIINDFVDVLGTRNFIQAVSVEASEYVKHHDQLLYEIELSLSEKNSMKNRDLRRRKEMLKKKETKKNSEIFTKKYYNI